MDSINSRLRKTFDYRKDELTWQRIWVNRHQDSGNDLYYTFDRYDRTKGWMVQPNINDDKTFPNALVTTNSKGFRGSKEYAYEKTAGKPRIVILGDSFTFGDEVNDNETYAYFLQQMLPQCEVINLGMHGYGHDQMLILLQEEGLKYHPDIVIIGFLALDMSRNLVAFRDFAKPKFVLDGDKLVLKNVPVPTPQEVLAWDWLRPRIVDVYSFLSYGIRDRTGSLKKDRERITTAIVRQMFYEIKKIGAVPVLAYLPEGIEMVQFKEQTEEEVFVKALCREQDSALCFSARMQFTRKIVHGEHLKIFGHWDASGHHIAATSIKDFLLEKGLIPAVPEIH